MSIEQPPTYWFPNINFNPAFYETMTTSGLSQAQANALYLQKTVPDTATALETFTSGISCTNAGLSKNVDITGSQLQLYNTALSITNTLTNSSLSLETNPIDPATGTKLDLSTSSLTVTDKPTTNYSSVSNSSLQIYQPALGSTTYGIGGIAGITNTTVSALGNLDLQSTAFGTNTINLGTTLTNSTINIGTKNARTAIIHIGDGDNNVAGSAVHINNGLNCASNVNILNGTGSTGTVNIGASGTNTVLNGTVKTNTIAGIATTGDQSFYTTKTAGNLNVFASSGSTAVLNVKGSGIKFETLSTDDPTGTQSLYSNKTAGTLNLGSLMTSGNIQCLTTGSGTMTVNGAGLRTNSIRGDGVSSTFNLWGQAEALNSTISVGYGSTMTVDNTIKVASVQGYLNSTNMSYATNITTGNISIGTSLSTGEITIGNSGNSTPRIANITRGEDVAGASKGCSIQIGQNANNSTYRLFLGSDINHTIYSTNTGNKAYWVEYGLTSDTWNFVNAIGTTVVATIGNTGVYATLSDRNKKKDFEPSMLGLNEILQLKPTLYRYKNKCEKHDELDNCELKSVGFIAQEVQSVLPQAYIAGDAFIGLDYNAFIPVLVKAVQEMKEDYEAKIQELKTDYDTKLSKLEERLLALEGSKSVPEPVPEVLTL